MDYVRALAVAGLTIGTLGKLLVAYAALAVHHRFLNEHKIDRSVFKTMKIESRWGVVGIALIIVGYFLELSVHYV